VGVLFAASKMVRMWLSQRLLKSALAPVLRPAVVPATRFSVLGSDPAMAEEK
jgi:hypothetical protein